MATSQRKSARTIRIFAILAASMCTSCIAGRVPRPGMRARMQVRVVRQCESTDAGGRSFAKVFVQAGTLTQDELDGMVLKGKCPELLFTSEDQKATFEACKSKSLPIELHVEPHASAGPPATAQPKDSDQENAMDAYVESYGNMGVHSLMLRDKPRCEWYRAEIERECKRLKDAVVLDVGCGTGLLSLFAARAGAKKVFAVESNRRMASLASTLAADNGCGDIVTVISGKIEDVTLPGCVKVDIIVSEWMGFYLLHESMLDSVLFARDHFLKVSGVMIPKHARLWAAPVSISALWSDKVGFLSDPASTFGLNYSSAAALAGHEVSESPQIELVSEDSVISIPQEVWRCNLMQVRVEDLAFIDKALEFSVQSAVDPAATSQADLAMHGICLWFSVGGGVEEASPDAGTPEILSTGPADPPTHWKQSVICLPEPLLLSQAETRLSCAVALRRGGGGGASGAGKRCRQYLISLTVSTVSA